MAQGSGDQRAVGTADPEESSPNMIVYCKVRPLVGTGQAAAVCACVLGKGKQMADSKTKCFLSRLP